MKSNLIITHLSNVVFLANNGSKHAGGIRGSTGKGGGAIYQTNNLLMLCQCNISLFVCFDTEKKPIICFG